MNGDLLTQKEMRVWVRNHSEEIAKEVTQHGIVHTARKLHITEYYVYAAQYLAGATIPEKLLPKFKRIFGRPKRAARGEGRLDNRYGRNFLAMSMKDRVEYILSNASAMVADFEAGMPKSEVAHKYGCGGYNLAVAFYLMGKEDAVPAGSKPWIIKAWESRRVAFQAKQIPPLQPLMPRIPQLRLLEAEESVIIMKYETTQLKQLRAKIAALEAATRETPDYAQLKADNERLNADNQMAWVEVERLAPYEKKCTELEKKYDELMQTVKENIAARVAADESLAHKP